MTGGWWGGGAGAVGEKKGVSEGEGVEVRKRLERAMAGGEGGAERVGNIDEGSGRERSESKIRVKDLKSRGVRDEGRMEGGGGVFRRAGALRGLRKPFSCWPPAQQHLRVPLISIHCGCVTLLAAHATYLHHRSLPCIAGHFPASQPRPCIAGHVPASQITSLHHRSRPCITDHVLASQVTSLYRRSRL